MELTTTESEALVECMSRPFIRLLAAAIVAACFVQIACSKAAPPTSASARTAALRRVTPVTYDRAVTDTARVLAGLRPENPPRFARVLDRPSWKAHAELFNSNWAHNEQTRFGLMRKWRDEEFGRMTSNCDVLFYPFGGPDALNAILLFPACRSYLLFGLEPIGSVPALDTLPEERLDKLTGELQQSMADLFQRNYFITSRMMKDLRKPELDGNMPLFLLFLARLDARVVGIDHDGPWKEWSLPGVSIRFVVGDSDRVQTLTYVRVNMENRVFSRKTGLVNYLKNVGPLTTFVKSASYLMHDHRFSEVRDITLTRSRLVLQDDSGIPISFFKRGGWSITLYGQYRKPVKDFNYGFQKDLDAAYKVPGAAKPLPFSFGYHWGDGGSSVMLAVRLPR